MSNQKPNQKILMLVAPDGFQDKEYFIPQKIFIDQQLTVITASANQIAKSIAGKKIEIDLLIDKVRPEDYTALVLIGGPGAVAYQDRGDIHQLIQKAVSEDKVVGAICIAPTILAKAGILQDKKATTWADSPTSEPVEILKQGGAIYTGQKVTVDGKIITANGPEASEEFAKEIVRKVTES